MELAAEEMDPQVPVRRNPLESLTDSDEASLLRDSIGGKVVELHPVVVAQPPYEPARRGIEAALVQTDEADDVALRGVGLPVRRQRDHPCRVWAVAGRRQLPAVHQLFQRQLGHPAKALLNRSSKPDPRRVRQAPQIDRVRDN
jgi:hypothetical protein